MNTTITTAISAARAIYDASLAFDEAKEALDPLIKQQIEITRKVVSDFNLKEDYDFRAMAYHDYYEVEIGGYYEGDSDTPVIEVQLWYRGRCGDSDSQEGSFTLDQHIIDGKPDLFEAVLRARLQDRADRKAKQEREATQLQIAALQAKIAKLQGDAK
jgi:hypothetical protein